MKYLNRVYRASEIDRAIAFSNEGLSGHQISYILQICHNPGLTQDELAKRLFVNKSSVTRQVSQMIKNGFIDRQCDKKDGRVKRLYPTLKAEELYPKVMTYLDEWNEKLTGTLDTNEQESLLHLMRHLAKASTESVKLQ